jgi:hypothetical protein
MPEKTTNCSQHGTQPETFVCQHLVDSLQTGERVGMCWSRESDQARPDAWCLACEERREAGGGEWTSEVLNHTRVKLLCGACYDTTKAQNYSSGG